jgi:23S rRNA maturation-related 3'-5' exoribonuclease YhaM
MRGNSKHCVDRFNNAAVATLLVQGDQKSSVHLTITVQTQCIRTIPHTTDELKLVITEYIRNVDRAILDTVFENTVGRVNKCLEIGGGHFEHYL